MDDSAGPSSAVTPPDQSGVRRLRLLVVDDQEDIREIMVRMVARLGHEAVEAEDGQHAVEALSADRFDVMLLDLSMPRMTGEEVVRWLRDHPEVAPDLRIVVVSAWAGDKRPALHELGVDAVLPKPFRKQQLVDLLDELSTRT
ncbi:response regulator [Nocardioides dokdonensis]|uniref:response regulator n=1 Tax=Nocardioides dokdonensis TaxID=450734 RepID=UPI000ADB1BED|nr:response regulator [Nocardioides dokdonensis]